MSNAEYAAEMFGVGGKPTKKEKKEIIRKLKEAKEGEKVKRKELKELFDIEVKREKLGLNPICPSCGRVMRTKRKDKWSGEYYCVCNPGVILCVG